MNETESSDGMATRAKEAAPGYRAIKAVVIILGLLIVLGLGALIVGLFLHRGTAAAAASAATPVTPGKAFSLNVSMPPGAQITEAHLDGPHLMLHLRTAAGETIVILDATDGHEIGQVNAAFQAPKAQ